MTIKGRLEEAARNGHCYLPGDEARKLLALLKAAKDFNGAVEIDETGHFAHRGRAARAALTSAIHAIEGPSERVAGRPERMPPGVEDSM